MTYKPPSGGYSSPVGNNAPTSNDRGQNRFQSAGPPQRNPDGGRAAAQQSSPAQFSSPDHRQVLGFFLYRLYLGYNVRKDAFFHYSLPSRGGYQTMSYGGKNMIKGTKNTKEMCKRK
jgi:hypothetical protein